ncbi:CPBP family intramembrane glutamic endopeptidase [Streptococcus loxodontisalivarius]|uniref:Membrane protease YdiL (CAAX protease family) n=1 Tax=Streptococcus loxodontisalivarius TaxID=1349415 RepID=A0ABS2PU25_9STRE|nr:type II CAAX endopeptidase family protein [Streptococcus loxodontisalivarius]MBM7643561.1 membrane protease YdiL (CAAX protease family) [Streptococcus loxodontisalivarius]
MKIVSRIAIFLGIIFLNLLPSVVMQVYLTLNKDQGQLLLSQPQLLVISLAYIIEVVIFIYLAKKWQLFGNWKSLSWKTLFKSVGLGFLAIMLVNILSNIFFALSGKDTSLNQSALIDLFSQIPKWLFFLSAVVVAPITEEIIYRGYVSRRLFENRPTWGIIFGALLFTLAHTPTDLGSWISYGGMATIFGFIYWKTNRLEYSFALHMFNNLLASLLMLLV